MKEMLNEIFDIKKFNTFSDDENYYFFRALNMEDINDIDSGTTLDENGRIKRIRTDRERYEGISKYNEFDDISLEQITDHIKMHHLKETNCISLTSNANTAITYGRGHYQDKYIMIKVPKKSLGTSTYEAGLYMLEQVNNYINVEALKDENLKNYIDRIDSCNTEEELTKLKQEFLEKKSIKNSSDDEDANDNFEMLEKGFEYQLTNSTNYIALDKEQNLVKNKIVLKMDLLNEQILSKISNRLLIKTIGNAFSSLELIHYKDIKQDEIIELPKEIIDVLALLQQMPANLEYLDEIKNIIISKIPTLKLINNFTYKDFNLEDRELSIENLYKITGGRISYGDAIDLYKNAFYLSKSKKRTYNSVKILNKLLKNNHKYKNTLNYM